MKMENRVVQTHCLRGDGGIFKSAQLSGGNVDWNLPGMGSIL